MGQGVPTLCYVFLVTVFFWFPFINSLKVLITGIRVIEFVNLAIRTGGKI